MPYLICLGEVNATYALREVHERLCGHDLGAREIAYKLL